MLKPLATIAMTAFNAEDTIERALASALRQDWRPIEILVVDDASTDNTSKRVSAMEAIHPEIRLIQHEVNGGVAAARNTLIDAAAGEFLVFFDDDDESKSNRVSVQIERILSYEAVLSPDGPVLCHTARRQRMPNGHTRIESAMGDTLSAGELAPCGRPVAERVLTGRPIAGGYGALATCSQAARRRTYRDLGGFDEAFRRSEDTEFGIRAALAGCHFIGVADPLVDQNMTMASDKTLAAEREGMLLVLEKHRSVFASARAYRFARRWIALKYQWLSGRRFNFFVGLAALSIYSPLHTIRRVIYALPMSGSRAWVRELHKGSANHGADL